MMKAEAVENSTLTKNLPNGWKWARLGEVCEFSYGSGLPSKVRQEGNVPVYGSNGIVGYHNQALTQGPTIIIGRKGSIGQVHLSHEPCWPIDTTYFIEHPKLDVDLKWLSYWLRALHLDELNKAAAIPGLNRNDAYALKIPLPPLAEQQRIVAILNEQMAAVQQAKDATKAQLEATKSLPSSYLRTIFDSSEAHKWPKKPLGEVSVQGPDNGIFKRRPEFGRGVPIVNVSDLYRSLVVDLNTVERVEVSDAELRRFAISEGDMFFCRSSLKRDGIGWCCYVQQVPDPAVFECHVMRIHLNEEWAIPEYVAHYWNHPDVRKKVIDGSRTATMTTMNQEDLAKVLIPLPPVDIQKHIAARLSAQISSVETVRKALEEQLSAIDDLPSVLLRQALLGEL